VIVGLE